MLCQIGDDAIERGRDGIQPGEEEEIANIDHVLRRQELSFKSSQDAINASASSTVLSRPILVAQSQAGKSRIVSPPCRSRWLAPSIHERLPSAGAALVNPPLLNSVSTRARAGA